MKTMIAVWQELRHVRLRRYLVWKVQKHNAFIFKCIFFLQLSDFSFKFIYLFIYIKVNTWCYGIIINKVSWRKHNINGNYIMPIART